MDPIDPISPSYPVRPIWPVWKETIPGFQPPLPDAIPYPLPKKRSQDPPAEQPAVTPFDAALPVAPPAAPPRALRRVLLDAGVSGIGPLGPGFPLTEREMVGELQWVYRHIAKSLLAGLPGQPTLPSAIVAALAHDGRDEREMGMLLIAYPKLADYLQTAVGTGMINRWHRQGEVALEHLQRHPKGLIGDLHLVEAPDHRWQPF